MSAIQVCIRRQYLFSPHVVCEPPFFMVRKNRYNIYKALDLEDIYSYSYLEE